MSGVSAKTAPIDTFISVVFVVQNQGSELESLLARETKYLGTVAKDYELVLVDNASTDQTMVVLEELTQALPNLQIYSLTNPVDTDTAYWVGLERALGDHIIIVDPFLEDLTMLPMLLQKAQEGSDIVFAENQAVRIQGVAYLVFRQVLAPLYRFFLGFRLREDAPTFRLLSREVVNYVLRNPHPTLTYRHLSSVGGFKRTHLRYKSRQGGRRRKRLFESIDRGIRLLTATTRAPLRLATFLCLFGAFANFAYSLYVVFVALWQAEVEPGWVSLSLQQSGMFFLLSVVLLVVGEYVLQMARLSNEEAGYHISRELTSPVLTHGHRLNIERVAPTEN